MPNETLLGIYPLKEMPNKRIIKNFLKETPNGNIRMFHKEVPNEIALRISLRKSQDS